MILSPQSLPASLPAIRAAGPDDAPVLAELGARAFTEAFGYLFETEALTAYLHEEYSVSTLEAVLSGSQYRLFLMELGEEAIGYVGLKRDSAHPFIHASHQWQMQRLYLLQAYIGHGLGPLLMKHAIACCRAHAPLSLWLEVADVNPRGKLFYERHGFTAAGEERKQFAGDWFTVTIMRRDIG